MDIPVVILCGGMGTRLKEETDFRPKPLVPVGDKPILWHIMKIYAEQGFNNFIICLGYKGEMIKEYFLNYPMHNADFTLSLRDGNKWYHNGQVNEDWKITFVETGLKSLTGTRIKKVEKYIHTDEFFCTYGDGVANVDLKALLEHHKKTGRLATITGVKQPSKYGFVEVDESFNIKKFEEKPIVDSYVNGGFFVFNKKVMDVIGDQDVMLEKEPFERLVGTGQISLYFHNGFWHAMDTFKEMQTLNDIWNGGNAPWKMWK